MTSIINAFTFVVFARSRHLRRRSTYLIMNLTVADFLVGTVSGPQSLWFFKTGKNPVRGFEALYPMIADFFYVASLGNLALISLERLHTTLYPFRHCLVGKGIYYEIIFFSWFGALTLASVFHIIRMHEAALGYLCTWMIYVVLTLTVLTTSYVITISKIMRNSRFQQLRSVIIAERKLSVTLFIVSAVSTLTLLPWVIATCIYISSGHFWIEFSPHAKFSNIVLAFYYLNSIVNPLIYAIRLLEFRRALKEVICRNMSSPERDQPIELYIQLRVIMLLYYTSCNKKSLLKLKGYLCLNIKIIITLRY